MKKYLDETPILDYSNFSIQTLIRAKGWGGMNLKEKIVEIHNYVRDEILFGYNDGDDISASEVLTDGYGQCNTKANLLMSLLRAVDIPCRLHGFTIDKTLQKGAIKGLWYKLAPQNILHTWVEVYFEGKWIPMEGVILDEKYLQKVQTFISKSKGVFCGYGIYTDSIEKPLNQWSLSGSYIQDKGINNDFGIFDSPDSFYKNYQQKLSSIKKFFYRHFIRKSMNRNISLIRNK